MPLREAAARLEAALETGAPPETVESARAETLLALRTLQEPLAAALPPETLPAASGEVYPAALRAACAELASALEGGSFEAQTLLQQHEALFTAAFGPRLESIRNCIGNFDFEGAAASLAAAIAANASAGPGP